ncbi:MAG: penicillin-binding protein 2 [Candidatus Pacebacteria bacterium]|nr:penicillin-binding protein 2 [Candidatus Paceibacterota bacterium]
MQRWRINLILFILIVFGVALIGRLFFIQVIKGDFYKALAQGLYNTDDEVLMERGEIFFKNGEPLAVNMEWPLAFSSPREVEAKEETAEKLAAALSLDKNLLLEKLNKDNLYELIKKKLTEEEIRKINELDLKGIYLGKELGRYYPQESFGSQLIGFLDANKTGQYGIEGYYDEILQGSRAEKGSNLILTVDYPIQFMAEKLLAEAKDNLKIEGGEIIVMDPSSGEILALANFPNFDPNQYSGVKDPDIFQDSVTQKIFEPGSVFKPITMAAALEEGAITPQTTYRDPGTINIGGWPISNYDNRKYPGDITMTQVLEKSINTGAVFAEQQLGNNDLFLGYIDQFGFFKPTGIDIQEIYSGNSELKKGYEINFATASFGQGIEMTPIQLIRAYAAIANGGKMVKPYIVKKIVQGEDVLETEPKIEEETVISSKTASQLAAMLISVVENGYAKSAKVPGYYIAGKTGTAQISYAALNIDKRGYSDKTWQSFMGFAPAFDPKFLILVKLDNPETKTAEYSAVPIFHDLAKYIIDYYQIPPDYVESNL